MQQTYPGKLLALLTGLLMGIAPLTQAIAGNDDQPDVFSRGAKTWANNCSRCHNYRPQTEFSDSNKHVIIQHMRIQGGLTSQEASDVYTFLVHSSMAPTSSNTTAPTSSVESTAKPVSNTTKSKNTGENIYQHTCITCHGPDGKGAIPGAPNFKSKDGPLSKADNVLLKHIKEGFSSPGSSMAMPPKGGNSTLTDTDLKSVLDYIRKTL